MIISMAVFDMAKVGNPFALLMHFCSDNMSVKCDVHLYGRSVSVFLSLVSLNLTYYAEEF